MDYRTNRWIAATLASMLAAVVFALPASADDSVVYDIDPGTGGPADASGTFTFDQTMGTITSWDISVVDGSDTITLTDTGNQSAAYGPIASGYDAVFSSGKGSFTYLALFFAKPGLGSITAGPATVPLSSLSTVDDEGTPAKIDNPSISAVSEPGTIALMLAGMSFVGGLTLRRRALDLAPATAV